MALFSKRFWMHLAELDGRVVASQRAHQASSSRLLIGRRLVTGASLIEYWVDLTETSRVAATAVADLDYFCTGRSKVATTKAVAARKHELAPDGRQPVDSSFAVR